MIADQPSLKALMSTNDRLTSDSRRRFRIHSAIKSF